MSARPLAISHPFPVPESTKAPMPKMVLPETGGHRLAPGVAMTLRPRHAGRLRVLAGRAWVTLGGPYIGHGNELGDLFLLAGDSLPVRSGACVVMESAPDASGTSLRLDWCEDQAPEPGARPSRLQAGARALWRKIGCLPGLVGLRMAGRGRVLSRWASNPP